MPNDVMQLLLNFIIICCSHMHIATVPFSFGLHAYIRVHARNNTHTHTLTQHTKALSLIKIKKEKKMKGKEKTFCVYIFHDRLLQQTFCSKHVFHICFSSRAQAFIYVYIFSYQVTFNDDKKQSTFSNFKNANFAFALCYVEMHTIKCVIIFSLTKNSNT